MKTHLLVERDEILVNDPCKQDENDLPPAIDREPTLDVGLELGGGGGGGHDKLTAAVGVGFGDGSGGAAS